MALNSYRIIETVHHSRRFILYQAEALADKKRVLIKTQDPAQLRDPVLAESLIQEAEAALELRHPAIRRSIAHFSEGRSVYMVAEYASGTSLADYLLQNPDAATLDQCLNWAKDILHALHYAQKRGQNHCNLNPYNLIIDAAARIKLIGFGKFSRDPWKHSEGRFNYPYPMLYVAPEIFKTSNPHQNSDLYSWAVVVYQMLCRQLPWRLDSFIGPDEQKLQSFSRGLSRPDADLMPDWLFGIIQSCLKLDPEERPQDIIDLLTSLQDQAPQLDWEYHEPAPELPDIDANAEKATEVDKPEALMPDESPVSTESEANDHVEPNSFDIPEESSLQSAEEQALPTRDSSEEITTTEEDSETEVNKIKQQFEEKTLQPEPEDETDFDHHPTALEAKDEAEIEAIPEPKAIDTSVDEEELPFVKEADLIPELESSEAADEDDLNQAPEPEPEADADILEPEAVDASVDEEEVPFAKEADIIPELESSEAADEEGQDQALEPDDTSIATESSATKERTSADDLPESLPSSLAQKNPPDSVDPAANEDQKDLSTMRKSFIILMLISIIILAYILIQHFAFREKPQFEVTEDEVPVDIEDITEAVLTENMPLEMVWVPSDTLIMGSISPEADDDEFPLLTIPLKGFMISPTEITQQQWNMVYSSNPSLYQGAELPVENVSFYDVIEYCNAKSLIDGLTPVYDYRGTEIICDFDADGYRLPTEAEWEFAAKAGIGKNFMLYSGSDDPDEIGWFSENSLARSHIVAGKEPNALDLYDMSGNVYEWVWNWYALYSYRIGNLYSGPINGTDKVIRGGSWYHNADHLRTTSRDYVKPYVKTGFIGFRVVRSR